MMRVLFLAMAALCLVSCGDSKVTEKDIQKAEQNMFSVSSQPDKSRLDEMLALYCSFVEQNPEHPQSPEYLTRALDLSVAYMTPEKSLEIAEKIEREYPNFAKMSYVLFVEGYFIYDQQLHDIDKAREVLERLVRDYPDGEFTSSARDIMENLGLTPEELIMKFQEAEQ